MIEAAKEEMLSGFGPWCAGLPLAADLELGENSRPGGGRKNPALHLGQSVCNSTIALGIEPGLFQSGVGSRIQTWNRYAYVGNNPLSFVDPLGLDHSDCSDHWYADSHAECPVPPCIAFGSEGCIPIPPGYPWGGGGGGGSTGGGGGGGGGSSAPPSSGGGGGAPLSGETLGLPGGLNPFPFGNIWNLFGFLPGMPNPWILDFLESGVGGNGTPDSPWTYFVQVLAPFCRTWLDGDFVFSNCGPPVPAPPEIRGLSEDVNTEFAIAGAAGTVLDAGRMGESLLFGNRSGLNAPSNLRIGWSWMRPTPGTAETGFWRFRITGKWLGGKHINLWPPSLWWW